MYGYVKLPRHYELFNPVLQAIRELSGSASIAELDETVTKNLNLRKMLWPNHMEVGASRNFSIAWRGLVRISRRTACWITQSAACGI
jgi:hypothetical protein